jgi:hypothetical protein
MKRVLITLLCTILLASCAAPKMLGSHAEYWAARGIDVYNPHATLPTVAPPTFEPSVSGWNVVGGIVAIPLLLSVAMITTYPRYSRYSGVHCRSYTYKDQAHFRCY